MKSLEKFKGLSKLLAFSVLLASTLAIPSQAQIRSVMEGVQTSNQTLLVSTSTRRLLVGTTYYDVATPDVQLRVKKTVSAASVVAIDSVTAGFLIGDGGGITNVAGLATETSARIAADNAIGVSTAAERASRISADNAIGVSTAAESAARIAADALLIPWASTGVPFGVASLDGGGKVPYVQLPSSVMTYFGAWNASTNSPYLTDTDPTASNGDLYRVSVAGSTNTGHGVILFYVGDFIIYNGSQYERAPAADGVTMVNTKTGAVVLNTDDIQEAGSPVNLWFTNARATAAVASQFSAVASATTTLHTEQVATSRIDLSTITTALAGKQATGNYITALTGNVTASGPGSVTATIASLPAISGAALTSLTAANISAGTAGINISGNAATVTTNANLTGNVTSVGNATTIASIPAVSGAALTSLTAANISAGTAGINITGNSATATALAANGTNCSAGNYPLGVDASGNSESCTAVPGASAGPTYQFLTSGSGATYTTAANTKVIAVECVGGGGGGGAANTNNGSAGGSTTFNSIVAAGGSGGAFGANLGSNAGAGGTGGSGTASFRRKGGPGGSMSAGVGAAWVPPGIGGFSFFGAGGAAPSANTAGIAAEANSGGGGSGGTNSTLSAGGGGGGGEYFFYTVTTPAASYTYTIGAGGGGGSAGGQAGGAGGSGFCKVTEYH